jgi:hypothetical protein
MNKVLLAGVLALLPLSAAGAVVITEDQSGFSTSGTGVYWGQSFTTGAGAGWNDISFNFYTPSNTPLAAGTGYIFASAYAGTVANLGSASPLAVSVSSAGGVYSFAPAFTLAGSTQYFFYSDAPMQLRGNGNSYGGGNYFYSFNPAGGYISSGGNDVNFQVNGTAVPEPATWAMLVAGFGLVGLAARRKPAKVHA